MTTQLAQLNEDPAAPERDTTDRSIVIGLACTLLFHILVVWLSPQFAFDKFSGIHSGISVNNRDRGKTFDFELAQPKTPEQPKNPFNFVETNPDAPDNTPDKTANFSNRNQQSAQPDPAKEKDPENRPSVKGQDEIKNDTAIVTGNKAPPQPGGPSTPDTTKNDARDQQEQSARAALVPLAGFEKVEGPAPDGVASNVSVAKLPTNRAEQSVEGAPDARDPNGALVALPQMSKAQPKERPRLQNTARSTILSNRATGVTNIGILGIDARWSEYGEYINELIEIVQTKWYDILAESRVSPPRGSHVIVTFRINSKGETEIIKVEDTDAGKQGVFSCQNAITYPQPYRKWSDQMIAVLGDSQELTFGFYYQ